MPQSSGPRSNLLIFQPGDFREAWRRLEAGGPETYRDQRRSVEFVSGLADRMNVTVVHLCGDAPVEELAPGLHAGGLSARRLSRVALDAVMEAATPDLIVVRGPYRAILTAARRRRVPVLPCFADSFYSGGLRTRLRNLRLRFALRGAPCIANHNLNASVSLHKALGVPAGRVIPWDWSRVPLGGGPKPAPADPSRPTLFFAGLLRQVKGVGDCLDALQALRAQGLDPRMTFAGAGDLDRWRAEAAARGLGGAVAFTGPLPHDAVRRAMREHDVVVVPSRHDYPEGLPNTIYEALASRSALVMSDHPAFRGRLRPEEECLVFRAADPAGLAAALRRAVESPGLYERLSRNSEHALDGLYFGVEWEALMTKFIEDPHGRTGWIAANSLARLAPRAGTAARGKGRRTTGFGIGAAQGAPRVRHEGA